MTSLRRQRIIRFRQDILAGERGSHDTLFRLLYGIPAEAQIELARHMTARYLPLFRSHRSDLRWVEDVLSDVDAYFSPDGRGFPEPPPDDIVQGDNQFMTAVFGLDHAWRHAHRGEQGQLTAVCCAILRNVVNAWAANVWRADEPHIVEAFEAGDRETARGHGPHVNVASVAVTRREWLIVADWLDEHGVGDFPDTPAEDEPDCERWLAWWQDREYLL
ncbi:hypothetical protein [Haliangium sp.]|uniref:hypothetical protein n=1 Tax=Haliangium sp. TaxID=2663208 RepID=UPI003D0DCB17